MRNWKSPAVTTLQARELSAFTYQWYKSLRYSTGSDLYFTSHIQ